MADSSPAPLSDDHRRRALMTRLQAGDKGAFERLYADVYPHLFRFIFRLVRQVDLVEELINETMLVVWEKPDSFDYSCKVLTWVFGIAYRKTLQASAKQVRAADDLPLDDIEEWLADGQASPARQAEAENLLAVVLDSLSPEHRAVIELTYGQGLHYREIAAILGCPENTVKTRMFYARQKLQALYDTLALERSDF